jgi:hypothetical protein
LPSFALILIVCALGISSCSSSAIKSTLATDQKIVAINLLAVRFFRPNYPVASIDDFSRSDRKLSCTTSTALWANELGAEKSEALINCLNSLKETAHYLYIPKAEPFLEIDPLKKEKELCIYKLLPTLPLPREIYFLGKLRGRVEQETFAMSFDTKANQMADIELRTPRFEVKFIFPLSRKLHGPQDLNLWLLTSTLDLFRKQNQSESQGELYASIVPTLVADRCFQDDSLFNDKREGKIPPVYWP